MVPDHDCKASKTGRVFLLLGGLRLAVLRVGARVLIWRPPLPRRASPSPVTVLVTIPMYPVEQSARQNGDRKINRFTSNI